MAIRNNSAVMDNVKNNASFITWTGLLNGDQGDSLEIPGGPDKTVTIQGTFGVGGSCTIEGSNDGTTWFPCTDLQANAITKTSAAMEMIVENPRYIRPNVTAGDGTTNLSVLICAKYRR